MFNKAITKAKYLAVFIKVGVLMSTTKARINEVVLPKTTPCGYPVKSLDGVVDKNLLIASAVGAGVDKGTAFPDDENTVFFTSAMASLGEDLVIGTLLHEEGHIARKLFPSSGMSMDEYEQAADKYMLEKATTAQIMAFTAYLEYTMTHAMNTGDTHSYFHLEGRVSLLKAHLGM